ncbi:hypothetical protein [Psychrobacter sp. WY6]|uniref:hypothetical protein n=1 Tax=Psychrobacter sp. WY6 TaxID=2708350 RepID=UPI00202316FE|nr:hypothetical protein [Psychrobacter sp. WY6]
MATNSLGRLTLDLAVRLSEFTDGLTQAEREARDSTGRISETVTKNMGRAALAFGAMAATGAAAIGVMVREQIELGTEITRLSRIANTGVEDMQKLAIAARSVGVEQDTLGDIYKDTQDKIGDFLSSGGGAMADYFENIAPLVGQTAEQFRELSGPDALQLYYDGLQQANISQSEMVFYLEGIASDASALIPLLHDAGAGFDVWATAAQNAGAVMDAETIRATQELEAATDLMMISYDGAKKQFTRAIIPVLSDVAGKLVENGNAADFAREAGESLAIGLKGVAKVGVGAAAVFDTVGSSIGGVAATIATLMDGVDLWDGGIAIAIKMARNLKAAGDINQIVDQDIRAKIASYGDMMHEIDKIGSGNTNEFVSTVMAQNEAQRELGRTLGVTGHSIKLNKRPSKPEQKH